MTISVSRSDDGRIVTLTVTGKFIFDSHRAFRDAYSDEPPDASFVVDLQETEYMDSSALGMLLLLREHVGGDFERLSIVNTSPRIRRLLEVSRFDRFFRIS